MSEVTRGQQQESFLAVFGHHGETDVTQTHFVDIGSGLATAAVVYDGAWMVRRFWTLHRTARTVTVTGCPSKGHDARSHRSSRC